MGGGGSDSARVLLSASVRRTPTTPETGPERAPGSGLRTNNIGPRVVVVVVAVGVGEVAVAARNTYVRLIPNKAYAD